MLPNILNQMKYISDKDKKKEFIQEVFSGLVGKEITGYELPRLWSEEDQEWSDWMDLPLVLLFKEKPVSISWTEFDDLAIEEGRGIPFSIEGCIVKWDSEGHKILDSVVGQSIQRVRLGEGDMSIEGNKIEVWTRLIIDLSNKQSLEIYNALDENGVSIFKTEINIG